MRKIIVAISFLVIVSNALCQKETFFNKFKTLEAPFSVNASTFDFYASESEVKLNESNVEKYLLSETDEFLIRKFNQKLKQNTYYDYFSVGKIKIKNYLIILYYRNYKTISDDLYIELMACIFNAKSNLCQTLSLSKIDTQLGIFTFCDISEGGDIFIRYYSKKAVNNENLETGIIKEIKYKLTNGIEPYQIYYERH